MKFFKIVIGFIVSLVVFAASNKLLTTLGMILINKLEIDTTLEFGHNIIAINTLVGFVVALFLAIKVFKMINKKNNDVETSKGEKYLIWVILGLVLLFILFLVAMLMG